MNVIQKALFLLGFACLSACSHDQPQPMTNLVSHATTKTDTIHPTNARVVDDTSHQTRTVRITKAHAANISTTKNDTIAAVSPHLQSTSVTPQAALKYLEKYSKIRPKLQQFTINPAIDTGVISENGALLIFPARNFIDANGQEITGAVSFQLMEFRDRLEAANAGIGTMTANGEMLETGGMFLLQATQGSTQLYLKQRIRIETTTPVLKSDFQVFEGTWLSDGSIGWKNPRPMEKEMLQIPLSELDFYKGLDSFSKSKLQHNDFNLCIADSLAKLKEPRFQNTWVATREFEQRVEYLASGCRVTELFFYLGNTDKPLWVVDSLVADLLANQSTQYEAIFKEFARQRCTKLANIPLQAAVLSEWFKKRITQSKLLGEFPSYPVALYADLGSMNIDKFVQIGKTAPANNVQIKVSFDNKAAPELEYDAILFLFSQDVCTFMAEKSKNYFLTDYAWLPDQQRVLVLIRDNENRYTGVKEFIIRNEGKPQHDITLHVDVSDMATNESAKKLIQIYKNSSKAPKPNLRTKHCCMIRGK